MKHSFTLLLCILISEAYSQDISKINAHVYLSKADHYSEFQLSEKSSNKEPNEKLEYFWYKFNELHSTMGGYEGKLLNGKFTDFYTSGSLKEKGCFEEGTKNGKWIKWREYGNIEKIENFKDGLLNGECKSYRENGELEKVVNYKRGSLHGDYVSYSSTTDFTKREFKNGVEKFKKIKEKPAIKAKVGIWKGIKHFCGITRLQERYHLRTINGKKKTHEPKA